MIAKALCACVFAFAIQALAVDINSLPKPTGYVSDLAHVVDPADQAELEAFATSVEQQLGVQFALVTIDSIGDQPIEDFAIQLARKWGVGDRKSNQGVLLLLAIRDHKSDVETGRGIEPYVSDGFAGSTLRSMRPELRASHYGAALKLGARSMAQEIAQGKGIAFSADSIPAAPPPIDDRPVTHRHSGGSAGIWIFFGILFLLWLFGGRRRGGGGGGGFLTGLLLGNLLNSGRGGGDRDWGDRGGFGGNSGGGGGFGGFGGGDFGGGGANSDW